MKEVMVCYFWNWFGSNSFDVRLYQKETKGAPVCSPFIVEWKWYFFMNTQNYVDWEEERSNYYAAKDMLIFGNGEIPAYEEIS